MNLSSLLSRLESLAPAGARGRSGAGGAPVTHRVGDVVVATGVANDLAAPANDPGRPHILAHRLARRERREIRSA